MKRLKTRALVAAGLALVATPLLVAASTPAEQVKTRVAGLHNLGVAFKAVMDGLRAPELDTKLMKQSARTIRGAAHDMPHWFPVGSGPQPGLKTSAKAEIWTKPVEFKAAAAAFAVQADAFGKVANGTDVAAIRMQAGKLGGTCKTCHESFRQAKP